MAIQTIQGIGNGTQGAIAAAFGGGATSIAQSGGAGAAAFAGSFDGPAFSREVSGLLGQNQQGSQNSQNQMSGLFNTFTQLFKTFLNMFQQFMNGGANGAQQNAQQNGAKNGGAAGNTAAQNGANTKGGPISGSNINNSVYKPNGIAMKPLDKYKVTSEFGNRKNISGPGNEFHSGIDLAAPAGTPIRSFKDGTVTKMGSDPKGYGNFVEVTHADGTKSIYAHMSSFGNIKQGMQIGGGSVLGNVGSTGRSTGPHLHFEVRDASGKAVNPRNYMRF